MVGPVYGVEGNHQFAEVIKNVDKLKQMNGRRI